jgi:CxxC motif-containing protein
MKKEFVCIVCPNSCRIKAEYDGQEIKHIEGSQCKKGEEFLRNEIKNPLRIFTGSVKCKNGNYQLVSVKTNKPIPKRYMKQVAQKTHELILEAPVEIGQVIVNNIISHDVNLVATRMVRKKGENV